MVAQRLPKPTTRGRFPSPAPFQLSGGRYGRLFTNGRCRLLRRAAMDNDSVGPVGPVRAEVAGSYIEGSSGRGLARRQTSATVTRPLDQRQSTRRASGHGESGQENTGCGQGFMVHSRQQVAGGSVADDSRLQAVTTPA